MKVLLTGASGQVGRALMAIAPPGVTVVGLARDELDITDEQAVSSCVHHHRPELIINAAAYTSVDEAEQNVTVAYRVNAEGPRYLATAACAAGARMIQISTDFVFDGAASSPYAPEAAAGPLNVYGASKRAGEDAILRVAGERAVVLRTAWVYADRGTNFLRTMLRSLATRRTVRVVADQVGTPTAAATVASAIWAIAARSDLRGIYHWTNSGVASWYDFAVAIAEESIALGLLPADVMVHPISTSEYPTAARRPHYSVLDRRALLAIVGSTPPHWRVSLRGVLQMIRDA